MTSALRLHPVSKADDATWNLETLHHLLQEFGIREEHIFSDAMTGNYVSRPPGTS